VAKVKFDKSRDWLYSYYVTHEYSVGRIAELAGVSVNTINRKLSDFGIPRVDCRSRMSGAKQKIDMNFCFLYNHYIIQEMTSVGIAKLLDCSACAVRKRLKLLGFPIRSYGAHRKGVDPHNKTDADEEYVLSEYPKKFVSASSIALALGCHGGAVDRVLDKHNIVRKPHGETRDMFGPNGGNWQGGKSHLWERHPAEQKEWRDAVYERDKFTCQCCYAVGGLNAHHIMGYSEYPFLRTEVSNGITLCQDCHIEFHQVYGMSGFDDLDLKEFIEEYDT
jgi:hypothetical protein